MHTLILLPGMACDEGLWAGQLPLLERSARVHVSDVHTRFDGLPEMAKALLAENEGPLVLAGASMGGMVAMHAALQAPQRIVGLALLGTSARADTPELIRLRNQACELFAAGRMEEVLRANAMLALHPDNASDPALVERYLAIIRRAGAPALIRQNKAVMARPDLREQLPRLRLPVLVAVGEADSLTPLACAREIADAIPGAERVVVPGAGHMLTLEQPAAVARLLLDWLEELPPPASAVQ